MKGCFNLKPLSEAISASWRRWKDAGAIAEPHPADGKAHRPAPPLAKID
ncbi:hypothetical protein [Oxynema aestuarii]|jgi:hypothetical protein|uniref:Uncharacterized protein n=1 Tax=Oxynema aestuarii AP17 TaxID=2064643 RepID=A0A6H1TY29_9CYAN|nr:hypothetical protein [Oxynema aestuarii]QIZ71491.1 hypothetical protein HCG48_13635 [Oxynema aestuarii AP17]